MAYVDQLGRRSVDCPAGAEQFSANAAAYKQQLQDLDDELRSAPTPFQRSGVLVSWRSLHLSGA